MDTSISYHKAGRIGIWVELAGIKLVVHGEESVFIYYGSSSLDEEASGKHNLKIEVREPT